jgi:AcrR family transcriptional regulator
MKILDKEAVLWATIEEGGNNPISAFSATAIAKRCGISERDLYETFKTQTSLLNAADLYLSNQLFDFAKEALEANETFDNFFNDLMLFQVRHPTWNGFWLNYSSAFPRFSPQKEENPAIIPLSLLQRLQKFFPASSYANLEEAFRFMVRESICFARYVIYSEVPGNTRRLLAESRLVYGGVNAFQKKS